MGNIHKGEGNELLEIEMNNFFIIMHQDQIRCGVSFQRTNYINPTEWHSNVLSRKRTQLFIDLVQCEFPRAVHRGNAAKGYNSRVDKCQWSVGKRPSCGSFVATVSDYKSHEVGSLAPGTELALVGRKRLLCWVALSCSPLRLRSGPGCAAWVLLTRLLQRHSTSQLRREVDGGPGGRRVWVACSGGAVRGREQPRVAETAHRSDPPGLWCPPVHALQFRELVRTLSGSAGGLQSQDMSLGREQESDHLNQRQKGIFQRAEGGSY